MSLLKYSTINSISHYHRLRCSSSTVVTMTSKVNGKMEILTPPVDLRPLKILKPKLERMITS